MPILLKEIHSVLSKDPDTVTLLSEEEIGTIISGLKQQTKTEIVTTTIKSLAKKSAKSITLADL